MQTEAGSVSRRGGRDIGMAHLRQFFFDEATQMCYKIESAG
jgi:hypothetical protein